MNSIPASDIVSILPGVVGTGGNPLSLNAVFITKKQPATMLGVKSFGSEDSVAETFGIDSDEYRAAQVYFKGFDNSTARPDALFIASYVSTAQPAKLVGAQVPVRTASDFANLPDGFVIEIDGNSVPVAVEGSVTSYSALAEAVTTSMASGGTCTYDSTSRTFVVSGITQGAVGSIGFASGNLAAFMGLTEEDGAQKNNGVNADTIQELMPRITQETRNFVSIMTLGDFSVDDRLAISQWVNVQDSRFMHVIYQKDNSTGQLEALSSGIFEADVAGTLLMYGDYTHGAFACGYPAALNFDELNGRTNFAFRKQEGLVPSVTDKTLADSLINLGFNFYGAYGTANDRFIFANQGSISGKYKWVDSYVNQVYLNSQLQLALMTMLTSFKNIPYNEQGKAIHRSAIQDPINQMLNYGAIQRGVTLSEQQKKQINLEAGFDAAAQLKTEGWCLMIGDTTAQTRGNRGSMPLKLWYVDGGSVQKVVLPSINVQ
ncbi:DUF3383 domain-containing protein [Providencia rettgeri]